VGACGFSGRAVGIFEELSTDLRSGKQIARVFEIMDVARE
jgi:hypothetical protein